MGKIPYMPLYIGDWEQDTNCLSIEAEGAWLKVVFKCWKNKGIFLSDIECLARLCKTTEQKFAAILLEWKKHDICNIEEREDGGILIICRRHIKDIEISQKRAVAGSKGGSKSKANSAAKAPAKEQQIPEYEYEVESDNDIENKLIGAFDEIYLEDQKMKWSHIDFDFEYRAFCEKVRGSPDHYRSHDSGGLRLAFQSQLRKAKTKSNGTSKNKQQQHTDSLIADFAARRGSASGK